MYRITIVQSKNCSDNQAFKICWFGRGERETYLAANTSIWGSINYCGWPKFPRPFTFPDSKFRQGKENRSDLYCHICASHFQIKCPWCGQSPQNRSSTGSLKNTSNPKLWIVMIRPPTSILTRPGSGQQQAISYTVPETLIIICMQVCGNVDCNHREFSSHSSKNASPPPPIKDR